MEPSQPRGRASSIRNLLGDDDLEGLSDKKRATKVSQNSHSPLPFLFPLLCPVPCALPLIADLITQTWIFLFLFCYKDESLAIDFGFVSWRADKLSPLSPCRELAPPAPNPLVMKRPCQGSLMT